MFDMWHAMRIAATTLHLLVQTKMGHPVGVHVHLGHQLSDCKSWPHYVQLPGCGTCGFYDMHKPAYHLDGGCVCEPLLIVAKVHHACCAVKPQLRS
jgi:hypothetical protein